MHIRDAAPEAGIPRRILGQIKPKLSGKPSVRHHVCMRVCVCAREDRGKMRESIPLKGDGTGTNVPVILKSQEVEIVTFLARSLTRRSESFDLTSVLEASYRM